jgi:hypothetical protein
MLTSATTDDVLPENGGHALPLFTTGTPHGRWLLLARGLLCGAPATWSGSGLAAWLDRDCTGAVPESGIDGRAAVVLDRLAAAQPQARFLIFVDGPAHAVASWLASEPAGDPVATLHQWCEVAQRVLRHVHGHPSRCLLIDTEEAARLPAAMHALLTEHLGATWTQVDNDSTPTDTDPLALALGVVASREFRLAQTLHAQLRASCAPLAGDDPADLMAERPALGAAVQRWRTVIADAAARNRVERDLVRARQDAAEAKQESDRLLVQLHKTQEELESLLLKDRADPLETSTDGTEVLRAAQARAEPLGQDAAMASRRDAERDGELQAARVEVDLLQQQLHTVQEELEHHYLALQAMEASPAATVQPSEGTEVRAARIEIGEAVRGAPYQHLGFELQQVQTRYGNLPRLSVRLVEHHGRPGLVFVDNGQGLPLGAWQPSGTENGRALMALLPADDPCRERLMRLAPGDWRRVVGLVALLRGTLARSDHPQAKHWHAVAARLQRQLAQLPPRLRYSRLQVQRTASADALALTFEDIVFGDETRDDLHLVWRPGAAPLLQAPAEPAAPPLAGWPVDGDGRAAAHWTVPVGADLMPPDKRRHWAALSADDREFVLGILDALPAGADQAADDAIPSGKTRQQLTAAAHALHREARQTLRQLHVRQLARLMLRRLRRA